MLLDKPYIVVAFYTEGTLYQSKSEILRRSLERFNVLYYIQSVPNLGSWEKNTSYKPTFLKQMIEKFPEDIVYVDVDAEFQKYPKLFDTFGATMKTSFGVYVFDRSCYTKSVGGTEVLSGTIYIKNTDEARRVLNQWEERTQRLIKEWDQKSLEYILDGRYDLLPGEYCKIFDRTPEVTDPVIVHFQASREVRREERMRKRRGISSKRI
jgi:hypothetical protein